MSTIVQTDSADRPADWPVNADGSGGKMHFRLLDQLLGPLDLSCDKGYVVRTYGFAQPETRAVTYNNALDDGVFDVTKFVGARAVSLDVTLKGTASVNGTGPVLASEAELRDRLRAYLHPARRPRLVFSEHEDPKVRQILLRGQDSTVAFAQPRYNAMSASWVAPRAYIESYQVHTVTVAMDRALGDTLEIDIVNAGNAPAYWAAQITGEVITPRIIIQNGVWGDAALQLDYTVPAPGDVVQIDSFTRSVVINKKPIGFRYISDQSQWFRIPPGTSHLVFDHLDPVRKGYEYGAWTDRDAVGGQTTNGMWTDRENTLPAPDPPDNPQGPPHAWSSHVGPGGEPAVTQIQFSWTDTWI